MKHQHIYDQCKQHMHSYVLAETEDGTKFDGILTGLDDDFAYFAIPIAPDTAHFNHESYPHGMMGESNQQYTGNYQRSDEIEGNQEETRQFGYGYPYYGWGYPGYGFGYRPRRFSRLVLPLAALVALTALPWY